MELWDCGTGILIRGKDIEVYLGVQCYHFFIALYIEDMDGMHRIFALIPIFDWGWG